MAGFRENLPPAYGGQQPVQPTPVVSRPNDVLGALVGKQKLVDNTALVTTAPTPKADLGIAPVTLEEERAKLVPKNNQF